MSLTPRLDRIEQNYIINGDMRIAQRGTSFAAVADNAYTLDRWAYKKAGAVVHTVSQDTDVPTVAQAGYLFQNSLRANLTTPDTSIAATDYCLIRHRVEGYNFTAFAQKTFTLSFWVKAALPGIYCVSCENSAGNRTFATEYTINATNTWEYKTLVIASTPSAGTWDYVNGTGILIDFVLAAGTNFQGTGGSWQNTGFFATANQINGVNTGATDFRITGVSLNAGELEDTQFSLFGKTFDAELLACKRYYSKSYDLTTVPGATNINASSIRVRAASVGASATGLLITYPVSMRTDPSVVVYNPSSGATGSVRDITNGADRAATVVNAGNNTAWISWTATANGIEHNGHYTADAEL